MPDTDYSNVTSVALTNNGTETVTIQMYRANLFKDIEAGSVLTLKITESEEAVYYKELETDTLAVAITSGGGGGSSSLADLTDVDLSSPEDGQMLKYDANSGKWVNASVPSELPTTPSDGSLLIYRHGEWTTTKLSLSVNFEDELSIVDDEGTPLGSISWSELGGELVSEGYCLPQSLYDPTENYVMYYDHQDTMTWKIGYIDSNGQIQDGGY